MKKSAVFFSVVVSSLAYAQKGTVSGTVVDDETGKPIIGLSVMAADTSAGTITDLDGNYSLSLEEGKHTLIFSYLSYARQILNDLEVKAGETVIIPVRMHPQSQALSEVTVTAHAVRNTEASLLAIQKKSANVIDGISSQAFERSGDGNAAAALKRVTGISVEDERSVYVRGLGDRYTKTVLNGMEIPGLDPDRNTVQMDIFPSSLIDHLIVYKNFSPDLSGDFAGGVVDIVTKDFPGRKTFSVSAGLAYNPAVHFRDDFILYDRTPADWMAFGKSQRQLPFDASIIIPDPVLDDIKLHDLTASFNRQMAARKSGNFLDQSCGLSHGNQIRRKKATWGYNLAFNYSNEYTFHDSVEFGEYQKNSNEQIYELEPLKKTTGSAGTQDILWSGLAGAAVKFDKHKVGLMLLHIQNGEQRAADLIQHDFFNSATLIKDNLEYTQRAITNGLVYGKHHFSRLEIEWKNALTYSQIADPDLRTTAFSVTENDTTLNSGDGAQVNRIFRNLHELNESFKTDLSFPFKQWAGLDARLKFGVAGTYKLRNYEILNYKFQVEGVATFSGDPDWLFREENIWMPESGTGTYVTGAIEPANAYEAASNVLGIYVMNELPLHRSIKAIYGVRLEKAANYYNGQNNTGTIIYRHEQVLDEVDWLPSLSLVYTLTENMNLRASYGRTVARPTFRENSIAQIYDPIQDRTYLGGIDLAAGTRVRESRIDNFDLRWEYFFKPGEIISVSGFSKYFTDPIEIVALELNPDNVQPGNVGDGTVWGMELELRKNFAFVHEKLKALSAGTNVTFVASAIKMSKEEYTGTTGDGGRLGSAREGETVTDTRAMSGQSPCVVNAWLSYANPETGWDASISYNVQGKRLSVVGSGRVPDVYELPFNSLNFKASKTLGKTQSWQISFSAENLLGSDKKKVYESFKAEERLYEFYSPGRSFAVGISYRIQ
ncbi:MAG TPA: TonB-dependent receptor [Chitinophagales bacterium]|nr:TonB-dependent receptor [Chitinophagales bacterium]